MWVIAYYAVKFIVKRDKFIANVMVNIHIKSALLRVIYHEQNIKGASLHGEKKQNEINSFAGSRSFKVF